MKKLSFVLLIIGIVVVVSKYFIFSGEKSTDKNLVYRFGKWRYQVENGTITLDQYTGKEERIDIPDSIDNKPVRQLGDRLFMNQTNLTEVIIPDNVTTIGSSVFKGCTSLKKVNLPDGILKIPEETFFGCSSLVEIVIPESVREIGASAFQNCENLQSVTIPDSVIDIGQNAFADNLVLSEIIISKNLRIIGTSAFLGTPWLKNQKEQFVIIGDQILLKYNGNQDIVEVPSPVSSIVDAFEGNVQLTKILLPTTLQNIGDRAFARCINLREIIIPSNVTSIQNSSFSGCINLSTLTFSKNLLSIGSHAFQRCLSLKTVIIPEKVKRIDAEAFSECSALQTVRIPDGVEKIEYNAFEKCPNLRLHISYGSIAESFAKQNKIDFVYFREMNDDYIFQRSEKEIEIIQYLGKMSDVRIPEKIDGLPVWKVGTGSFQTNSMVRSVIFPSSIKEIGDFAFSSMRNLENVMIFENLEKIGKEAFSNNPKLVEITISSIKTDIAKDAFKNCPNLRINAPANSTAAEKIKELGITAKIFSDISQMISQHMTKTNPANPIIELRPETPFFAPLQGTSTFDEILPLEMKPSETTELNLGNSTATQDNFPDEYESMVTEDSVISAPTPEKSIETSTFLVPVMELNNTQPMIKPELAQATSTEEPFIYMDKKFRIEKIRGKFLITQYIGNDFEIVLPDNFEGNIINGIGRYAFSAKKIDQITIPEGYIQIDPFAFSYMPDKIVVTIPASVTDIASNAFEGSQAIIRGYVGTMAEEYAREHNIQFRVIIYE